MKKIKIGETVFEIYIEGTKCKTVPSSLLLEDSIEEMLEDIGTFDKDYLQELYNDNETFYIS